MFEKIENYYKSANINPLLLKKKMKKFEQNPDIANEFEYWIENGKYTINYPVEIEGYTALSISHISKFLDGEAAFQILIELRENPKRTIEILKSNFKYK